MAAEEKKIRYDRETEIAYSKLQDALDMAEIIFCEYDIKIKFLCTDPDFMRI